MAGRGRRAVSYVFGESKPRKRKSSRATRAAARTGKALKKATRPVKPFRFHV